ncbi:MAG: hypothetical protein WA919_09325 [Coleofasciculaceae cyanobacterium]
MYTCTRRLQCALVEEEDLVNPGLSQIKVGYYLILVNGNLIIFSQEAVGNLDGKLLICLQLVYQDLSKFSRLV